MSSHHKKLSELVTDTTL